MGPEKIDTLDQKRFRAVHSEINLAKFKTDPNGSKNKVWNVMATTFWVATGILMVHYFERRHTITGYYLISKLRECIKEKRREKLSAGILFHQDNAPLSQVMLQ